MLANMLQALVRWKCCRCENICFAQGGMKKNGTEEARAAVWDRCYLDTVDGEHEAVLHDPGHGSSQHVGASGGTLWQTLIVRLRVLRAADNVNSLDLRLSGDSRRQAPHDALRNSPKASSEPPNFRPGGRASNPGIVACTLRCHPTPHYKSIRFHEKTRWPRVLQVLVCK